MQAEDFALRDGLKLCNSLQLSNVEVESDSKVAVQVLQGFHQVPWQLSYAIRRCRLRLDPFKIQHVFRERNQVADKLAAHAYSH